MKYRKHKWVNDWLWEKNWKKTIPLIWIFSCGFVFIFGSCQPQKKETREELTLRIERKVEEKLGTRRAERMNICKKNALKIAEVRVDSLLMLEAKLSTFDTFSKPERAIKPIPPIILMPKDSSQIKPLFEEIPDSIQ